MSVNLEPFRVVEAPNSAALIKEGFATAFELPDSVRVQGEPAYVVLPIGN